MAKNDNIIRRPDGTLESLGVSEEVAVTARTAARPVADLEKHYNPEEFMSTGFLQSSKFNAYFIFNSGSEFFNTLSAEETGYNKLINSPQNFRYYCDSIEFPGSTLTATDYRVPGKVKIKVPYLRDLNEINLTFYYPIDVPLFQFFNRWIRNISITANGNEYFDNFVCSMVLNQFDNYTHDKIRPEEKPTEATLLRDFYDQFAQSQLSNSPTRMRKQFTVTLVNAYPLSVTSLQSNWADDGFHKINVSLFFEDIETTFNPGLNAVEHGFSRMLPARGQAALDRDVFNTIGE